MCKAIIRFREKINLMEKISRLPTSETIATTCVQNGQARFLITSKQIGSGFLYTLYEICGEEYVRIGKGSSPLELENKFHIW